MILKNDASKAMFLEEIKNKKLYCYGAGKIFEDFLLLYDDVEVCYVIDKRAQLLQKKHKKVNIIGVEQFVRDCNAEETVLLITCMDYLEIQEQLQQIESLEALSCYVYCIMQAVDETNNVSDDSNKFQLTEYRYQDCMAGQKAPSDVIAIAAKMGYKTINLNRGTVTYGIKQTQQSWKNIAGIINKNSNMILQLPLADGTDGIYNFAGIKDDKNIKIISIVHDINILRGNPTDYDYRQYEILKNIPDILIVHNNQMKKLLRDRGFNDNRMISLDIFDYIISDTYNVKYSDGVIIAGNLSESKAGYIYKLNDLCNIEFNLFGANYNAQEKYKNINYFGAFLPDELIKNLTGKYGLVWDGDSIETCSGGKGEYLRINNPHKLSLYLAVGLPVIIWDEAAEAEFVLRENVGITVKSLYDLSEKLASISDNDYEKMKKNAEMIGERLRNGVYMTKALNEAEEKIQEIRDEAYKSKYFLGVP